MAEIKLIRVDYRLIHGQVATKWTRVANAQKIVVVDDESSKNETMKTLLKLAAPQGMKCLVYSVERCIEKWNEKQFGEGTVMMVFKDIDSVYQCWKGGLRVDALQLGNVPNNGKRQVLYGEVHADEKELAELKEMAEAGTDIEIHTIPEVGGVSFNKIVK